jgi:hypothetical protein
MLYELARRVVFPWDYYIWSESPFLTNLLKISNGQSLFGDPRDVNAYVYAPGPEYVTYALLRPLSLQLDVRACRVVSVLVGLGAAYLGSRGSRLALLAFALVLFKNFTFDVCHPDNFYAAHAGATFVLCALASSRESFRLALAAVVVAALGVLAKQSAALSCAGVLTALLVLHGRAWGLRRSLALGATAAAVLGAALALLLHDARARFFLFELVNDRPLELFRARWLVNDVVFVPHRAILVAAAAVVWMRGGDRAERAAWLALGAEVAPSLLAYFKTTGTWNNLGIVDYWLALLVIPSLWRLVDVRAAAGGALLLLLVAAFPTKLAPSPGQYAYGRALDERLGADLAAGRRVLLPHGTMPLLRAGSRDVPLDRAATSNELTLAGKSALGGTRARIEEQHYDRIYLVVPAYPKDVLDAIEATYRETERLPGDATPHVDDEYYTGYQGFLHEPVRVMERR